MQTIINGFTVIFDRISNYKLYSVKDDSVVKPEVPKFYIETQERWVENPFHPDYKSALNVYAFNLGDIAFNYILNNLTVLEIADIIVENKTRRQLMAIEPDKNIEFLLKKYVVFNSVYFKQQIINNICLTENRVYNFFQRFQVERDGMYILDVGLKNAITTTLETKPLIISEMQIVNPIDEYKIVTNSNLDWNKWINNEYTLDDMAITIALYRLNKIIESHQEDEIAIEQERKSKKH